MSTATATEKKTRRKDKHDSPPPTNVARYTKGTEAGDVPLVTLEMSRRLVAGGKCGTIDRDGSVCDDLGFPCPKHLRSQVLELLVSEPTDDDMLPPDVGIPFKPTLVPMTFGPEIRIPLDEIYFGDNPRLDQKEDSGKMEGMRTFARNALTGVPSSVPKWGNPIWVTKRIDDEHGLKWNCIDGVGRCTASKAEGWSEINATEIEGSQEDIELTRVLANEWPRRLKPYDLARFLSIAKERTGATSAKDLIQRLADRGVVDMISSSHYMKLDRIWRGLTVTMREHWRTDWFTVPGGGKLTLDALDELAGIEDKADQQYAYDQWLKGGKLAVHKKPQGDKRGRGRPSFMFLDSPTIARRPKELVNRVSEIHNLLVGAHAPAVVMTTVGAISKALITDIPLDEGEFKKWIASLEKHAQVDAKPARSTPVKAKPVKIAKTKPVKKDTRKKAVKARR